MGGQHQDSGTVARGGVVGRGGRALCGDAMLLAGGVSCEHVRGCTSRVGAPCAEHTCSLSTVHSTKRGPCPRVPHRWQSDGPHSCGRHDWLTVIQQCLGNPGQPAVIKSCCAQGLCPGPFSCHPLSFTSLNYIISHSYNIFKYFAQRNNVPSEPWVHGKLSNTSIIEPVLNLQRGGVWVRDEAPSPAEVAGGSSLVPCWPVQCGLVTQGTGRSR